MAHDSKTKLTLSVHALKKEVNLEFLAQASQSLWREPTFERLLKKFLLLLKEHFFLNTFAFGKLQASKGKISLERTNFKSTSGKPISAASFTKVQDALAKLDLKNQEYRQGFNLLHLDGIDFYFLLLGDPAAEWDILLWQMTKNSQASKKLPSWHSSLDFITRQLQSSFLWFQRLDKTQALLYRDDLTGLFNVRYLDVALDSEIRRVQRFKSCFSLLFIDLDNFKEVNDTQGHLAGTNLLKQVADVLRSTAREVDIVTRYGGDEFIVILLGANPDTALLAGERIRRKIEATAFPLECGEKVHITASIGVATCPDHALDKTKLLNLADEIMYESKRRGKNRVTIAKAGKASPIEQTLPLE